MSIAVREICPIPRLPVKEEDPNDDCIGFGFEVDFIGDWPFELRNDLLNSFEGKLKIQEAYIDPYYYIYASHIEYEIDVRDGYRTRIFDGHGPSNTHVNPTSGRGQKLTSNDPPPQASTSVPGLDDWLTLLYKTIDDLKDRLQEAKHSAQKAHNWLDQENKEATVEATLLPLTLSSETRAVIEAFQLPQGSSLNSKKCAKIMPNLGKFDGTYSRYDEWWTKMMAWIEINHETFKTSKQGCLAALSQIGNIKEKDKNSTGAWARNKLKKRQGLADHEWPTSTELEHLLNGRFRIGNERDIALRKLMDKKQGLKERTQAFLTTCQLTLYDQAQCDPMMGIALLERNSRQDIIKHMFLQGERPKDITKFIATIQKYANMIKAFETCTPSFQCRDPNAMDIDATITTTNVRKTSLGCYNCGTDGHWAKECKKPSTRCKDCGFSRGGHRKECPKFKSRNVRSAEGTVLTNQQTPQSPNWEKVIQGMVLEVAQANFHDLDVTQGRE